MCNSGKFDDLDNDIFNNSLVPTEFKNKFYHVSDIQQQRAYRHFSDAAFDGINMKPRNNDTEIKFIEWFLDTQWSRGNKFEIELESVLFACPSCQRHLMMLVEYGRKNSKTIKFKYYAHPKVKTLGNTKTIN